MYRIAGKDAGNGRIPDVEKGEARTTNGSSNFHSHNSDLQRASSKGSVLSTAGKVNLAFEIQICFLQITKTLNRWIISVKFAV